ncbi:MAG: hypothetical protein ACOYOS_12240 [Syntrophales bacterium]
METEQLYLREQQVAAMTGIPVKTLRNNRYMRKGLEFIRLGRSILYEKKTVIDRLAAGKIRTTES